MTVQFWKEINGELQGKTKIQTHLIMKRSIRRLEKKIESLLHEINTERRKVEGYGSDEKYLGAGKRLELLKPWILKEGTVSEPYASLQKKYDLKPVEMLQKLVQDQESPCPQGPKYNNESHVY